jgi:predicted  nucleic acid-binding Zn-ribbon protein
MSTPELGLIKEFLKLHKYVTELGNQFILSYQRLESIEKQLQEMSANFNESFAANRKEIIDIKDKMFTKTDFEEFIVELQLKVEETLPPLPVSSST